MMSGVLLGALTVLLCIEFSRVRACAEDGAGHRDELRAALESARKANEAKNDFLSRMSHEIRTPINAIIGMTKIALQSRDEAKMRGCLEKIELSTKQLKVIIDDVLDVSEIESHQFTLVNAPFDIRKTLDRIRADSQADADSKNQALSFQIDDSLGTFYVGDEPRFSQVATHLLSNALKFTPENGRIFFSARERERSGDEAVIELTIRDTGIGIPPRTMQKLFLPFEQGEGGIARRFSGTGLGLAISRSIAELMGGSVSVQSEEGKGSTFTAAIKFLTQEAPSAVQPAQRAEPAEEKSAGAEEKKPAPEHAEPDSFDPQQLLPFIDVKRGLEDLKGNAKLYVTLLRGYQRNDVVSEIRSAFSSGDLEKAMKDARALCGIAENLAMADLRAKAELLEESLRAGAADTELLGKLEAAAEEISRVIPGLIRAFGEGKLT